MAKTGERKAQILQTLASMLEEPKAERVTTALLAAPTTGTPSSLPLTEPTSRPWKQARSHGVIG